MIKKKSKKPPAKAKRKRPEYTISEHMYAISIKLEALASGQAMLSERFTSLLGIANHCDRLVKEKETLQKRVAALEMSAGIAAYDREIGNMPIPDGALELTEETPEMRAILKKWVDSYKSETMERNILLAKPREAPLAEPFVPPLKTFADKYTAAREAGMTSAAATYMAAPIGCARPPVACDHDILSPHATLRYLDGKRWCDACQQWIPSASMAGLTGSVTPDTLVEHKDGVVTIKYGAAACGVSHLHVHGIRCNVCGVQG
jgi:hypothetical protein